MFGFILQILAALALVTPTVFGMFNYTDYDNDFVNPSYILAGHFNASTANAQKSIIDWADWLAAQGPWCEHIFLDTQSVKRVVLTGIIV
jgi:hypothetical protein